MRRKLHVLIQCLRDNAKTRPPNKGIALAKRLEDLSFKGSYESVNRRLLNKILGEFYATVLMNLKDKEGYEWDSIRVMVTANR